MSIFTFTYPENAVPTSAGNVHASAFDILTDTTRPGSVNSTVTWSLYSTLAINQSMIFRSPVQAVYGGEARFLVPRIGDLITQMYLYYNISRLNYGTAKIPVLMRRVGGTW
eukprot:jgi/Mesvir1/29585/Mv03100-RA.1